MRVAWVVASAVMGTMLMARPAAAIPYETFIDIAEQTELDDLLASQDISQETYNELLDLLNRGVNLNEADRAELYALPNLTYEDVDKIIALRTLNQGVIRDPADLVAAGALSEEKFLAIAAFITVGATGPNFLGATGWIRAMTRWTYTDDFVPPVSLRSRVMLEKNLQAGIAMTMTRLRVGDVTFDPNRNALVAEERGYQFHAPKAYLKYEDDHYSAIVGTYRAGFGQRLVFDNSSTYTPNGLYHDDELFFSADLSRICRQSAGETGEDPGPCSGDARYEYETPDFSWRNGLRGIGVGIKKLDLPTGWLQAYAWASLATRSIYQYELVNGAICEDPHSTDPACSAPPVYVRPKGDLLDLAREHIFATLPDVFEERLVGASATYYADRRNSIGAVIYGATEKPLTGGFDLDFQEWARYPYGGPFGAAGANFSLGKGAIDVFGEAALSYDSMTNEVTPPEGGGGPAAVLRVTHTQKGQEIEAVARYYSVDYANPYARPIAQSDEFDGQRARDELGGRLRFYRTDKLYSIRSQLDLWVPPSTLREGAEAQPKLDAYTRVDIRTSQELWFGLWERYQDKDLSRSGHGQCFEIATEEDATGAPIACGGRQLTTTARLKYIPKRGLSLTLMGEHQMLDDPAFSDKKFRHDLAAWFIALWNPSRDLRMRARLRFLDEAVQDNGYLERSLSSVIEAAFRMRQRDLLKVRIDTKSWLDKRGSTEGRDPNPEATLWLSYEARI